MQKESFVVDPRPTYHYRISGARYTLPQNRQKAQSNVPPITLLFFHATGLHKETWEPAIESLLRNSSRWTTPTGQDVYIEDAWSIGQCSNWRVLSQESDFPSMEKECPNHGQSSALNAEDLRLHYTGTCKSPSLCLIGYLIPCRVLSRVRQRGLYVYLWKTWRS